MPTPCGLGLKFTVGTAVSVSPLGLLGGGGGQAAAQERRPKRGGGGGGGGGGRGDRKDFQIFIYIRDIFNKIFEHSLFYFWYKTSARDHATCSTRASVCQCGKVPKLKCVAFVSIPWRSKAPITSFMQEKFHTL